MKSKDFERGKVYTSGKHLYARTPSGSGHLRLAEDVRGKRLTTFPLTRGDYREFEPRNLGPKGRMEFFKNYPIKPQDFKISHIYRGLTNPDLLYSRINKTHVVVLIGFGIGNKWPVMDIMIGDYEDIRSNELQMDSTRMYLSHFPSGVPDVDAKGCTCKIEYIMTQGCTCGWLEKERCV